MGWDLTICLWLGPPWFSYWFSFTLAYSRISHEYSPLVIIVINLIFMFSLWCIDWVGSLYANRIFMFSCIKSSIGTQGEVAGCKGALTPHALPPPSPHPPPPPHDGLFYWPFYGGGSGVGLTLCCYVAHSTRRFVLTCYFVLVLSSPFSIAITSLGEERANLSTFLTFVRFALVFFFLFPLPLGVWEGLRLVIVALPGLFSYFFERVFPLTVSPY